MRTRLELKTRGDHVRLCFYGIEGCEEDRLIVRAVITRAEAERLALTLLKSAAAGREAGGSARSGEDNVEHEG